jgi:hypothetical protein
MKISSPKEIRKWILILGSIKCWDKLLRFHLGMEEKKGGKEGNVKSQWQWARKA